MNQQVKENQARHRELGLSDEDAVQMYAMMRTARMFDERVLLLQRAGKINFHVSGVGQEVAQVAAAWALDREQDYFLPYYRDYGFVLSVGMTFASCCCRYSPRRRIPRAAGARCRATLATSVFGS